MFATHYIECGGKKEVTGKKLIDFVLWHSERASKCEDCVKLFKKRKPPENPPCEEKCGRIALAEENSDALMIYYLTRGQVVSVSEQVIDINHIALWENIDRYGVKKPVRCFELVNRVFHHMLSKQREERG